MTEISQEGSQESATAAATDVSKKAKTEIETVEMTDGRSVGFAGKKRMDKEVIVADGNVSVRFDFRNGETRTVAASDLPVEMQLAALGHGLSQKIGDETAGEDKLDDMLLSVDNMIERLKSGEWKAAREAGDSFSGASVVIRALCEQTGKPVEFIKAFLQKKLDAAKTAGQKLTRQALYSSFRVPGNPVAAIIDRLEAEQRAKTAGSAPSAQDLLDEIA